MNIGYYTVDSKWIKASELMNYTFNADNLYEIQVRGKMPMLMYDGTRSPEGNIGFIIYPNDVGIYKCIEGEDLYIRSLSSQTEFNISKIGD